jgi:DnaJ family protein A protein 2
MSARRQHRTRSRNLSARLRSRNILTREVTPRRYIYRVLYYGVI